MGASSQVGTRHSVLDDCPVTLQATGVKVVADYVAQLRRIGKGHGVFHFDQVMAEDANRLATPSARA